MSQKRKPNLQKGKKTAKRKPLPKKPLKKKVKKITKTVTPPMEKKADNALTPPDALRLWFQSNVDMINITGWERKAALPKSTLRQISAGKRNLTRSQLMIVTNKILPELEIIVNLLRNYDKRMKELSGEV